MDEECSERRLLRKRARDRHGRNDLRSLYRQHGRITRTGTTAQHSFSDVPSVLNGRCLFDKSKRQGAGTPPHAFVLGGRVCGCLSVPGTTKNMPGGEIGQSRAEHLTHQNCEVRTPQISETRTVTVTAPPEPRLEVGCDWRWPPSWTHHAEKLSSWPGHPSEYLKQKTVFTWNTLSGSPG